MSKELERRRHRIFDDAGDELIKNYLWSLEGATREALETHLKTLEEIARISSASPVKKAMNIIRARLEE